MGQWVRQIVQLFGADCWNCLFSYDDDHGEFVCKELQAYGSDRSARSSDIQRQSVTKSTLILFKAVPEAKSKSLHLFFSFNAIPRIPFPRHAGRNIRLRYVFCKVRRTRGYIMVREKTRRHPR